MLAGHSKAEAARWGTPKAYGGKNTISKCLIKTVTSSDRSYNFGSWALKLHSFTFS